MFICLQLECLQEGIKQCASIQEIILDALIDAGDADTLHWWPYSVTYSVIRDLHRDTVGYSLGSASAGANLAIPMRLLACRADLAHVA